MKTLLPTLFLLLLWSSVSAQVIPFFSPSGWEEVTKVSSGPEEDLYLVLGYDENSDKLYYRDTLTFLQNAQMAGTTYQAIVKLNAAESVEWTRVFSSSESLFTFPFTVDAEGRVQGIINFSGNLFLEDSLLISGSSRVSSLLRFTLDDQGNVLLIEPVESFGETGYYSVYGRMVADPSSGSLYELYSYTADSIRIGGRVETQAGAATFVLSRKDKMGNTLWEAKAYTDGKVSSTAFVLINGINNGQLYLSINTKGSDFIWNGQVGAGVGGVGGQSVLTIDAVTGQIVDVLHVTHRNGWIEQVLEDEQGNRYIQGTFRDTLCISGTCMVPANPLYGDDFIAKLNAQNQLDWVRTFGHPTPGIVHRITEVGLDADDQLVVVGHFADTLKLSQHELLVADGTKEVFVAKLNADNQVTELAQTHTEALVMGISDTEPRAAAILDDGNIWVGGQLNAKTDFGNGNTWSNTNYYDGFLWNATPSLRTDLAEEDPRKEENWHYRAHIKLYPNPAAEQLTLQLPPSSAATVRVFSLHGQVLHEQILSAYSSTATIQVGALIPGIYLLHIQDEQGNQWREKFVKE